MNRSTWTAVLATVLILVGATCSTYLPWGRLAAPVSVAAAHQAAALRDWLVERQFVLAVTTAGRVPQAGAIATVASGAVGIAAASAAAIVVLRARRRRRPVVLELARRGGSVTDIARRTGMSQDAVRLLLAPRATRERHIAPAAPTGPATQTGMEFRDDPAAFAAALRRAARGGPASR